MKPSRIATTSRCGGDSDKVRTISLFSLLSLPLTLIAAGSLAAQDMGMSAADMGGTPAPRFESRRDSLDWEAARRRAENARGLKVVIDIFERRLFAINDADTLLTAPVAVGRGTTLEHGDKKWKFDTPRGTRSVISKRENPVWVPPLWHYVELAQERGFSLKELKAGKPVTLRDGSRLEVRGTQIGLIKPDSEEFKPLPRDEEVVFDNTLFIPPFGTDNRRVEGQLGKYSLGLGDGYMLHGTPHQWSIGTAASHGCVRMRDEDIEWLYHNIPQGTKVYIF
jgi:hypothetical protein